MTLGRRPGVARACPSRRGLLFGVTSHVTAQAFLHGQLAALAEFGPRTLVCSGPAGQLAADQGATFHEVVLPREPDLAADGRAVCALVRVFRTVRPELSVVGTPKMGLLGGLAARVTGVPKRVYVLHGLRLEGAEGLRRVALWAVEWATCRLATDVVAVSPSLRATAIATRVVASGRIRVLGAGTPNGVDTTHYRPPTPDERRDARASLGLGSGAAEGAGDDAGRDEIVVFVGRLTRDKGVRELADAWTAVSAQRARARLVLAGSSELDAVTAAAVQRLASSPRVHLLGHTDPRRLYWAADLLVLPTYREGLPTVVVEAAASGLPAVVTAVTGAVDAIEDGVTGRLVPARDADALARAVVAGLEGRWRDVMGAAARRRAVRLFERQQVWEGWRTEFRRLGLGSAVPAVPATPSPTPPATRSDLSIPGRAQ